MHEHALAAHPLPMPLLPFVPPPLLSAPPIPSPMLPHKLLGMGARLPSKLPLPSACPAPACCAHWRW
eukprot:1149553-Pelagomonas_calceolata.AAC.2